MRREHVIWVLVAMLAYALFRILAPFWSAVAWAAILGTLLWPLYTYLERWIRSRRLRALLVSVFAALVVMGPFLLVMVFGAMEVIEDLQSLQRRLQEAGGDPTALLPASLVEAVRSATEWLAEAGPAQALVGAAGGEDLLRSGINQLFQSAVGFASLLVTDLLSLSLVVVMTWIALFYLLEDGHRLLELIYELLPFSEGDEREFVGRIREMVFSVMYSNLAVAAVQGCLGGVAFALVGIPNALLWGVLMSVVALVPIFGTGLVWLPAAVVFGIQGRWGAALFLVLYGGAVIALADNLIRPLMLSGRARIHPLLVFLGVLGGLQAFGVLGLFLGPVLVAVLVATIDFHRRGPAAAREAA